MTTMLQTLLEQDHHPEYLGDGLYVSIDRGRQLWLRADRGPGQIHAVALEPAVLTALFAYVKQHQKDLGR